MTLNVAFQMDPIEGVDISADSTFRLAEAAQARGHKLWVYTPDQLVWRDGEVRALAQPVEVRRVQGDHATPQRIQQMPLQLPGERVQTCGS